MLRAEPASSCSSEVRASDSWRSSSAVLSCKSARRWVLTLPLYSACVFIVASGMRWLGGGSAAWSRYAPGPRSDHYGAATMVSVRARPCRDGTAGGVGDRPRGCRQACWLLEHTYDPK